MKDYYLANHSYYSVKSRSKVLGHDVCPMCMSLFKSHQDISRFEPLLKQRIKCPAQGQKKVLLVRLNPATVQSEVEHSTTGPLCSSLL